MKVYATEEEQVESIKNWLKEYGSTVILSVAIVIAISYGWRFWQGHQETINAQASSAYEELLISQMNGQPRFTTLKAQYIIKQYPSTPYAKLAAFVLAQQDVYNNNYSDADQQLKWVVQNTKGSMQQIAKIRYARVLLAEGNSKQALSLLDNPEDKAFISATDNIRGDIYLALGNKTAAKEAYQAAYNAAPNNDSSKPLIQMKLADLASSSPGNDNGNAAA